MADGTTRGLDGLELRHLEAFRAVTREGTFAAAATSLGYTQSAVSQQIAGLERVIGERVFERQGGPRRVRLTATGRMVLGHAEDVLDRVGSFSRELSAFRSGVAGRIEVGVFQSVSVKLLPVVVGRLREIAPRADVRPFESVDDLPLLAKVVDNELDLTFATTLADVSLRSVDLTEDPFVAVVPRDYPGGDTLSLSALDVVPLIGQPPNSCQKQVDAGLANAAVTPDYVFRTADNAAVQAMVRAGMGIAIMPVLAVDTSDVGVRICNIDPPIPARNISLVIGPNPSPIVEQFVEIAVEVARELS
jgi:DNA-binding transcriptional LysR family regulator